MEKNDWHLREASAVLSELKTDMYTGLSTKEAVIRRRRGSPNRVWYIHRTSVKETIVACLSDLATLLLAVTAIFAAIFEESRSALAIVGILILGALLRTVTYCKAKRILEDNASIGIPTCSVLRDSRMLLLSAEELVVGDIVFLEGGDMVPADGRIVAGDELAVSERGITANRDTVQKFETVIRTEEAGSAIPAEYRSNLLYAGSTVLWGQARMVVTATGEDTLIVRKQGGIRMTAGEKLPLMERLTGWCRISALVMLACVLLITALALFLGHGFTETFLSSMVLAVASMSEYLTAIAYIIIAIAVQDTGRQKRRKASGDSAVGGAVIGDSTSLERIAGIRRIVLSDIQLVKSGEMTLVGWFTGDRYVVAERAGGDTLPALARLLRYQLATVGGSQLHTALSGSAITAMPEKYTMLHQAADSYTQRAGKPLDYSFTTLDHVDGGTGIAGGLDTVLVQEAGGEVYAVVSGDIQRVMLCCTQWMGENGKDVPLDGESRKKIFTEAARLTISGARVIACAKRTSPYTTLNRLSLLQSNMTFVGFCAIAEPAGAGVKEAAAQLREAGVSLLLLSSEPERDLYYGREIGLFDPHTVVLTGAPGEKLPEKGCAILEVPPVQTTTLARNVDHSQIRHDRLQALLAPFVPKTESTTGAGGKRRTRAAHTATVVRNVLDARLLTVGDAAAAVAAGNAAHRPLPQPLKAKADMTVYPTGGSGGFAEVVEAMFQSRRALYHMWCAAVYLSVSQFSRMVLLLCSVLFRYSLPSPAALLFIGLIIDFVAVLVLAFVRVPEKPLTIPAAQLCLPHGKRTFAALVGLGLLWGLLEGCLPLVCGLLSMPKNGILLASILLTQLLFSGAVGQRGSFFRCRFHVAYGLYALLTLGMLVLCLLWEPLVWYGYFLSLVPALVLLAVWEGWKQLSQRKKRG